MTFTRNVLTFKRVAVNNIVPIAVVTIILIGGVIALVICLNLPKTPFVPVGSDNTKTFITAYNKVRQKYQLQPLQVDDGLRVCSFLYLRSQTSKFEDCKKYYDIEDAIAILIDNVQTEDSYVDYLQNNELDVAFSLDYNSIGAYSSNEKLAFMLSERDVIYNPPRS